MDTGANRLRTTPEEFHYKVRSTLRSEHLSDHKIDQVQAVFNSSLMGDPNHPHWKAGIDQKTLDQGMKYMETHPHVLALSEHERGLVREAIQYNINHRI